jgi:predicted DNA-binding transcriptional regulator YafY
VILKPQVANLWEVKRWLIGWGAAAKVLGPSELKQSVICELEYLLKRKKRQVL